MATEGQVVEAIYHILQYSNGHGWRGNLNDDDYRRLNEILNASQTDPTHWANRVSSYVPDTLIGALRNQWPMLFDGPAFVNPTVAPPQTVPATTPPPAPGTPQTGPPPPAAPQDLSGEAAQAAKRLDAALAKNRTTLNTADDELADAVLHAQTTSEEGRAKLQALQQSIIDEVKNLGPNLDTPAGQQQFAQFLQGKTAEILNVVKNAGLDSQSQASILHGLTARYDALANSPTHPGGDAPASTQPGSTPSGSAPAARTEPGEGPVGGDILGNDPLLGGLGTDPLMSGLGALAPAMGALGGIPAALGSMMPMGGAGGGLPLGDLGAGIGGALRDATSHAGDREDQQDPLKDPATGTKPADGDGSAVKARQSESDHDGDHDLVQQAAGSGGGTTAPAAGSGQASGAAPPEMSVTLPDGTAQTVASGALAKAGRAVLDGASIDEAYPSGGIQLPPLGSPVTAPIAPGHLQFGDLGQFTDHRVMALGPNKVWVNGQVTPLEQVQTGPNFLGWQRLAAPAGSGTAALAATGSAPNA